MFFIGIYIGFSPPEFGISFCKYNSKYIYFVQYCTK